MDTAWLTAIGSVIGAIITGAGGIFLGLRERKNIANKNTQEGEADYRRDVSENTRYIINELKEEAKRLREEITAREVELDHVWSVCHEINRQAQALRYEATERLYEWHIGMHPPKTDEKYAELSRISPINVVYDELKKKGN